MRRYDPQPLAFFETAPFVLRDDGVLRATPEEVFDAYADVDSWPHWFPTMHSARWLSTAHEGVGAEREVALYGLGKFRERFLVWERGRRFAFTMYEASSPFASSVSEDFQFHAADGGRTRIAWTFAAAPTFLGLGAKPVLGLLMPRIVKRSVKNLERYLAAKRG